MKNYKSLFFLFFFFSLATSFESIFMFFRSEVFDNALLVTLYVTFVVFIEVLALFFLSLVAKKLLFIGASALLSANLFSLKLNFIGFFQSTSNIELFFLACLIFLVFFITVIILSKNNNLMGLPIFIVVTIMLVVIPILANFQNNNKEVVELTKSEKNTIKRWGGVSFKEKPNIHLISFDSMISDSVASSFMNIKELPYSDFIKKNTYSKSPSFTHRVSTKNSLNSIMNLDQSSIAHRQNVFSGQEISILSAVTENNGYDITTGYSSYYFGKKGDYVDNYNVYALPQLEKSILCIDEENSIIMQTRFFGVCTVLGEFSQINELVEVFFNQEQPDIKKGWVAMVLDNIHELSKKTTPQLSFHYIYKPIGHTASKSYSHADADKRNTYKEYFLKNSFELNKVLHRINTVIRSYDPNSIVMIFGDHGAYLSRGITELEYPEFFYADRHSVELTVLKTEHRCSSQKAFYYSNTFSTPSRVLASVFRCLSTNPKKIDSLVAFDDAQVKDFVKTHNKIVQYDDVIDKVNYLINLGASSPE